MVISPTKDVTRLLINWGNGDQAALDELIPLVYDELRRLAGRYMRRESQDHTLQTSALVNEAYIRLVAQGGVLWGGRPAGGGRTRRSRAQAVAGETRRRDPDGVT